MELSLRGLEQVMSEILHKFNALTGDDPIFWFCALAGSGMFIIQFILTLFGADHEDMDSTGLRLLSKQALSGFLMMFGWVGLTCKKEFHVSELTSALLACVAGTAAMFISAYLFKYSKKLCSTGTIFKIEELIGKEATIYQRIPLGGVGKISVSLHQFTHEIEAISTAEEDLDSFTSVQIIEKVDEKTVIVIPLK